MEWGSDALGMPSIAKLKVSQSDADNCCAGCNMTIEHGLGAKGLGFRPRLAVIQQMVLAAACSRVAEPCCIAAISSDVALLCF